VIEGTPPDGSTACGAERGGVYRVRRPDRTGRASRLMRPTQYDPPSRVDRASGGDHRHGVEVRALQRDVVTLPENFPRPRRSLRTDRPSGTPRRCPAPCARRRPRCTRVLVCIYSRDGYDKCNHGKRTLPASLAIGNEDGRYV